MRVVSRYLNPTDAAIAQTFLEANGHSAVLVDADTAGAYPGLSFAGGGVGVAVREEEFHAAAALLARRSETADVAIANASHFMRRMAVGTIIGAILAAGLLSLASQRLRAEPQYIFIFSLLSGFGFGVFYASRKAT